MYTKLFEELGVAFTSDSGEFLACHCPFHDDDKASAGISKKTGVFNCYRCGSLSPTKFIEKLIGCDHVEAIAIFEEFRQANQLIEKVNTFSVRIPRYTKRLEDLALRAQTFTLPNEVVEEYMCSRGLLLETLKSLQVGYLPSELTSWGRDSLVFPYAVGGRVVGVRYRDFLGNKGGEPGCHFTLWGIDCLTEADFVVVVEGETDRLAAYQALGSKYIVVSTPTAAFRKEWGREFENIRQVILVPQADEATDKMVQSAASALGSKLTVAYLPWHRREFGKDVCDWLRLRGAKGFEDFVLSHVTPMHKRFLFGYELEEAAGEDPTWYIDGLLAKRQVCVIGGPPKTYKTWLALNMVKCLLEPGTSFCGVPALVSNNEVQNILFVEEEGPLVELYKRAKIVLEGTDWRKRVVWGHHLGIRFDSPDSLDKLSRAITEYNVSILIVDPFQRTYTVDENDASEMGKVWDAIQMLLTTFPDLSVVIIHHFTKIGSIAQKWKAFRGSSRTAAEADLGIFVDVRRSKGSTGIEVAFDGRSINAIVAPNGSERFCLFFESSTGSLVMDTTTVVIGGAEDLEATAQSAPLTIKEAAERFKVSTHTVRNWVAKSPNLTLSSPSAGKPALITYNEEP